jgi:hypothetical protein
MAWWKTVFSSKNISFPQNAPYCRAYLDAGERAFETGKWKFMFYPEPFAPF